MKKLLLFLSLIFLSNALYSQKVSFENVLSQYNTYGRTMDTSLCKSYYFTATQDAAADNLSLTCCAWVEGWGLPDSLFFQKTFWYLLEKETCVVEHRQFLGSNEEIPPVEEIPAESQCYTLTAKFIIEQRYGDNFISRYKIKADSLDKIGMGYEFAAFKRKKPYEFMVKKSKYRISDGFTQKGITVTIIVNEKGNKESINCTNVNTGSNYNLPLDNPYVIEATRLIVETGEIKPAMFNGVPIRGDISFYLGFE